MPAVQHLIDHANLDAMNAPLHRLPWLYQRLHRGFVWVLLLAAWTARAQSQTLPENSAIDILAPPSGTRVAVGGQLVFEATAVDPLGDIRHVEFFANGDFIGASDYLLKIAVIPGRPIPHRLAWKPSKPGRFEVLARAKDTAGKAVTSKSVRIDVEEFVVELPRVGVEATRAETSEPRPEIRVAAGQFTLKRTGSLREPLGVLVVYGGSATPGLDYQKLPNEITFAAGKADVVLDVVALEDRLREGVETVSIEIVQPPIKSDPLAVGTQLPKPTYLVDGAHGTAKIVIHDGYRPDDATIDLLEPKAGSIVPSGRSITLRALAVDPKGAISRVEFFAGDDRIGVSEIIFIREPDPGTPIEHHLEWKGAKNGEHLLTVRGKSAAGLPVDSEIVPIVVGLEADVVVLEVEAADEKAVEPSGGSPADLGVFIVRRVAGPKDVTVPVAYALDGGARNGVDYERLTGRAELRAGADSVRIAVVPIGDKALEGDEKVLLELESPICPAIFPPPPWCYRIGPARSAVVLISDSTSTKNVRPVAKIVAPKGGSSFVEGETITIRAEASDEDGKVERLDILADGELLASDKDGDLTFEWKTAAPGLRKLAARAVDDDGAEWTSSTVSVVVRAIEDVAFVRRDLPPAYMPSSTVDVVLMVEAPRGGTAWIVEDGPPTGWAISEISDEGVHDAVTGRVKFGPYTDGRDRRLAYKVAVPAGATGSYKFGGKSSLDGRSLPVAGDDTLRPVSELHPADITPANKTMVADEVTAYAAAWKRGRAWGEDDGTIPVTYVTRAGFLWKSGETYRFDLAAGAPPACWIPATTKPEAGRSLAGPGQPEWLRDRVPAERRADSVLKPGAAGKVEIVVRPPPGTTAVAVEETVPPGWKIRSVSDGGSFDDKARKIRWGLFFGDAERVLAYSTVAPTGQAGNGVWAGRASFDGVEVVIGGAGRTGAGDSSTLPRIRGSKREGRGSVRFQIDAPVDQILAIEASDDLKAWSEIGVVVHTGDDVVVSDEFLDGAAQRYFRLRPISP